MEMKDLILEAITNDFLQCFTPAASKRNQSRGLGI